MSVSKKQRTAKEAVYEAINKDVKSVCSGQFYIKNRKVSEACKKCEKCAKYKLYKQKTDDNPEVTYLYVDSFRECELYKMELPKKEEPIQEKKEQPRIKTQSQSYSFKPFRTSLIKPISSFTLKCEAYDRMQANHGQLLDYLTWTELFALEVMMLSIEKTYREFIVDGLCKQEIKKSFRKFYSEYERFKNIIRIRCYDKDEKAVTDAAKELSFDVMKLRFAISNHLKKLKVNNSDIKAHLLSSLEIMHEVTFIHNENVWNAQQKEKNLQMSEFLVPKTLISLMDDVLLHIAKKDSVGATINLNEDINIINGLNAIRNKIRNAERISNMLENLYKLTESRKRQSNNNNK